MRLTQRIRRWASETSICSRIMIANSLVIISAVLLSVWLSYGLTTQEPQIFPRIIIVLAIIILGIFLSFLFIKKALQPVKELGDFAGGINHLVQLNASLELHNPDPNTCQLANTMLNLIQQLESSNHQLRLITERAMDAQEEERRRIARWLHDDTGQTLLSLILNLEQVGKKLPPGYDDLLKKISDATDLARGALQGLRQIIYGLRPSILDDLGLGPAIRWYANSKLEQAGIHATVKLPEDTLEINQRLRTSLFRIAQEGINNIVYHSKARNANITLESTDNEISLSIEDDGCGFQPAQDPGEAIRLHHWGLVGIQERCELIGGSLNIQANPGQGTLLQVIVPAKIKVEAPNETN